MVTVKNKAAFVISESICSLSFPGGSVGRVHLQMLGDLSSVVGQEDDAEKEMATHSSFLA